ncbi:hypothetical protein [Mycobacterium neumannii]|uniref:hypothetical protein n=1 Tax=Mycobacterium neumannii TaxID=2048551 RepID=UPI003AB13E21
MNVSMHSMLFRAFALLTGIVLHASAPGLAGASAVSFDEPPTHHGGSENLLLHPRLPDVVLFSFTATLSFLKWAAQDRSCT